MSLDQVQRARLPHGELNPEDYPHMPEELLDFRNFLYFLWDFINLPDPTPIQYEVAEYLQHGPRRRIIEGYRGVGKSFVTSAYALWCILLDPDIKIMVVSASGQRAKDFSTFVKRLIMEWPVLQMLRPDKTNEEARWSVVSFDVGPAQADHSPTVKSVGITGQLTGSRADLIIADDIETPENSETQFKQLKLESLVKEFDAVIKPGGHIVYLGTPQVENTLYSKLTEKGWTLRIWPARYPKAEDIRLKYGKSLSPGIAEAVENGDESLYWQPTDPLRFDELELSEKELSYGPTGFALQFMLDTSLADSNRYPLRLSDLIVMDVDPERAPEKVIWCNDKRYAIEGVPNVGLTGDALYGPMEILGDWLPYDGVVMAVDPSGRGKDETSWAIVGMKSGTLYLLDSGGTMAGFGSEAVQLLAERAKRFKAREVILEDNFGGGAFAGILKRGLVESGYPCTVTGVWHSKMKEMRILDAIEPVWANHKLVVSRKLIEEDYWGVLKDTTSYPSDRAKLYRLLYQSTRMQRLKGCLMQDDRVDVLAMAIEYWDEQVGTSADSAMEKRKRKALDAELKEFSRSVHDPQKHGPGRQRSGWI
jgi:hypothetical protein